MAYFCVVTSSLIMSYLFVISCFEASTSSCVLPHFISGVCLRPLPSSAADCLTLIIFTFSLLASCSLLSPSVCHVFLGPVYTAQGFTFSTTLLLRFGLCFTWQRPNQRSERLSEVYIKENKERNKTIEQFSEGKQIQKWRRQKSTLLHFTFGPKHHDPLCFCAVDLSLWLDFILFFWLIYFFWSLSL